MFEVLHAGLFHAVSLPVFGKQDTGVSPGGAMDLFSYETGNALLGNPADAPALEILMAPVLKFTKDAWFVVTGAGWESVILDGSVRQQIRHGEVFRADAGDILSFNEKKYGFRSYLCYKAVGKIKGAGPRGRKRGAFSAVARWPDPQGLIRVVEGPEYCFLKNPDDFFQQSFRIEKDSNAMGLRLKGRGAEICLSMEKDMVSEAVCDGTVQLTPGGPVVLLRHRQTIGGYPRIFNVITADLDTLAQVGPCEIIRFKRVALWEAMDVLRVQKRDLERIRMVCKDHGG